MATAVISGRVDVAVRDRAAAYIHAAGLTAADVIKTVWENIARTGQLPDAETAAVAGAHEEAAEPYDPMAALRALTATMPEPNPEYAWLSTATPQQLKDFLAQERLKVYERLQ